MRKLIFMMACFFMLQPVVPIDALQVQKGDRPRAFLLKPDSNVKVRKDGASLSVWSNKSTVEEILEGIVAEQRVILNFYCQDPSLKQERGGSLAISGDSITKVLGQLLSKDCKFNLLDREGKPTEEGKDAATVNIYSKECPGSDPPVRVFIPLREHPLLRMSREEVLVEQLRDIIKREGPASRRRATDMLGTRADEKAIAVAKEAVKDENFGVMLAAYNALLRLGKRYGDEKVAGALYERFREKPYAEFLPIMAEVDKNGIWPIIDGFIDQSGEREKGIIVKTLLSTNDRRAVKYLSKVSSSGSMEISRQAIHGMGRLGGPEAGAALMKLLRGGDAGRKAMAAQAVHFLPKGEGLELRAEVEKMVRQDTVPDALLRALAAVSYLDPFEKLMKDPASKPELKIRALKALGTKEGENPVKVMSLGLNDKNPQVRVVSVEQMQTVGMEEAVPYLVKATEDKDANVRWVAVKSLADFPGEDEVVGALGKAVNDTDQKVRRAAVEALKALGPPNEAMIAILRNCKNNKDPYVAEKADATLKYWGKE